MRLLVVEDEIKTGDYLRQGLAEAGFQVSLVRNGLDGHHLAMTESFDLIVLDVMLPDVDGWRIVQSLREAGRQTPVLFLTARDRVDDRVKGLELGADDYLVKPFAMEELVMRVKALAKRRSAQNKQLAVSGLVMDLSGKSVSYNGVVLHCSPTGFKLLEQLMRASPNPIDRDELVELVWGEESPDSNSLKVHMHKLRKVLSSASVPMEINFKTQVGFSLSPVQES